MMGCKKSSNIIKKNKKKIEWQVYAHLGLEAQGRA
jgi:hypothetical protein